jgi:predicted outer membrane repeat protein
MVLQIGKQPVWDVYNAGGHCTRKFFHREETNMKREFSKIRILTILLVLSNLFIGCENPNQESSSTIRVTIQNNSDYKLYSVRAGGVEMGDIEIGTTKRKDIEPDELSYSVFFTIKAASGNVNVKTVETKTYTANITIIIDNNTMIIFSTGNQTGKPLSQFINDIETGNINYDDLTPGTLPEGSLEYKLSYITSRSESNVLYDIAIDNDLSYGPALGREYLTSKGQNVVIHIHSASANDIKTIQLTVNNNNIFAPKGITLRLSNIILKGISNNSATIVCVEEGGTLIIEEGTVITGNTVRKSFAGSGVYVDDGGRLIMNGGKITENKGDTGCGIELNHSSYFIMNGGEISYNNANVGGSGGGGVLMSNKSTFVMNGGKIINNSASIAGGVGYSGNCSFTMNGGEISGNSGTENAGGVLIFDTGSFIMTGGVIKNNYAGDSGGGIYAVDKTLTMNGGGSRITVSITGGEITGNNAQTGGGVALYNSRFIKTGGYIAGTDAGLNANISTRNEGDAVIYCRDYIFWDRKLSLRQNDNLSTDNLDNGWTYLGPEGSF